MKLKILLIKALLFTISFSETSLQILPSFSSNVNLAQVIKLENANYEIIINSSPNIPVLSEKTNNDEGQTHCY